MLYFCCTELRRDAVAKHPTLNGIDFLEVKDDPSQPVADRQRTLLVRFAKNSGLGALAPKNIRIEGGERIRNIVVTNVSASGNVLTVVVDKAGDFSIYTLRLVRAAADLEHDDPPDGIDPLLSAVDFTFKIECPTDFDCKPERICPPEPRDEPEIDYLAKDYNSFRQLMLDRMAEIMPLWTERNPADAGITLVELLAYVGDHLSYRQDAIATEAYIGTARRRASVRRHARLVDYRMNDGCNARAWVQVQVSAPDLSLSKGTPLLTSVPDTALILAPNSQALTRALNQQPAVFETMRNTWLGSAHDAMQFYTWGENECCVPKGATRATLCDSRSNRLRLCPGDVLVFEERLGPDTGNPDDANPAHRHAVRLTRVLPETKCELKNSVETRTAGALLTDPLTDDAIVKIEWAADDALPFAVCISSKTDKEHGERVVTSVSVALGNIVLADQGMSIQNESLGSVPDPVLSALPAPADNRCATKELTPIALRYRPYLSEQPLSFAAPLDASKSATHALQQDVQQAAPLVTLRSLYDANPKTWTPVRDLLSSAGDANEFVVEVESDRTAYIRFGDDQHGARPASGTAFTATYRVGNGARGNVGADAIKHIVTTDSGIAVARNPLPAQGGAEPESIEDVRQRAPAAFRTQQRAVTEQDYADVVQKLPGVQRAAATFRWTGSWRTVFVTVDRLGGRVVDDPFKQEVRDWLERFRMAGHDVEVNAPLPASLEIEMLVCVKPEYFRADVKKALLELFSNRVLPDGRLGVFHPDNFTFGQSVYLSPLYAAAQRVEGVSSVVITTFQRQGTPSTKALADGKLALGRLEIARLDNDPNFPERGVFRLTMQDGK